MEGREKTFLSERGLKILVEAVSPHVRQGLFVRLLSSLKWDFEQVERA
jgi:hypothetical protein